MYSIPQTPVNRFSWETTGLRSTTRLGFCSTEFLPNKAKSVVLVSQRCRWFQPNVYVLYLQKEYSCVVFCSNIAPYAAYQVNTDCSEKRIYGGTCFVLFFKLVFFNAINMLYVYSLNKNITVCKEVSNECLFILESPSCMSVTSWAAVDKTVPVSR